MDNILPIAIPVVVGIFLIRAVKIAPENSCFAVFSLGQYEGLRGPGLHFKWSGNATQWIKIEFGERGQITAKNSAKVRGIQLPIVSKEKADVGIFVRIAGFRDNKLEVILDRDQSSSYICEECGHENKIT